MYPKFNQTFQSLDLFSGYKVGFGFNPSTQLEK